MANIVVLGGGFGGATAAEALAKKLATNHKITLVSRSQRFVFYPSLVRFAFGQCEASEIQFDLPEAMLNRRVRFVEGEVARVDTAARKLTFARGDFVGDMPFDYLIIALGRRLRTELITGFYEHAHHLLGVRDAEKFGEAVRAFHKGRALIGHCAGAKLPVPIFETAFALAKHLTELGERGNCSITVVSHETLDQMFEVISISDALRPLLASANIELISDFAIDSINSNSLVSTDGRTLEYDLNMIVPPFGGPGALVGTDIIDHDGYVRVDKTMRVDGHEGIYAAEDCVNFGGPKMAYMAVRQAEVAANNVAAALQGKSPVAEYEHDLMLVIDAGDSNSTFVNKDLWRDTPANIQHSRFWGWAKRKQGQYWKARHN